MTSNWADLVWIVKNKNLHILWLREPLVIYRNVDRVDLEIHVDSFFFNVIVSLDMFSHLT